jgi:NifU-like protein involved in Fe-S cluster formation
MVNKDSSALTANLLAIARERQLITRVQILTKDVIEEAVVMTRGQPGKRSSKAAMAKAINNYQKLSANKLSRAFKSINECKNCL